ncbi:DUF4476 domain-containing protein [Bacteroidaceae bacterium]|jgi:hypothetical protein
MRRLRQTVLALALGAMICSCGSGLTLQGSNTFMKIKPGMAQAEVTEILGKPTYHRFDEGGEQWEYQKVHALTGEETRIIINFTDGYVSSMDSFDGSQPAMPPVAVCPPAEVITIEPPRRPNHPDNHRPRHRPMSAQNFDNLYNKVKRKPFKDDQMELLSVGVANGYFTCNQCARLMSIFTWDDEKMKVLKMMSERLVDRENGEEIVKKFDSLFKQDDAKKILGISGRW